jgi:hypothetical protein
VSRRSDHPADPSRRAGGTGGRRDYQRGHADAVARMGGGGGGRRGCRRLTLLLLPLAPLLAVAVALAKHRYPSGPLGSRRNDPKYAAGHWDAERETPPEHQGGWPGGRRPPLRDNTTTD